MTPALSLAALFPGLANMEALSKDLAKLAKKDLAPGEESWLAVLLAWLAPSPLVGPAVSMAPAVSMEKAFAVSKGLAVSIEPAVSKGLAPVAGKAPTLPLVFLPLAFVPQVLEASPPALPLAIPSLADAALALAPPPSGESSPALLAPAPASPGKAASPLVAEPVLRLDPPPPAPEAFRLEVQWQPRAAEAGRSAASTTPVALVAAEATAPSPPPAKPDRPEAARLEPVAPAGPPTAAFPADGQPERDPNPDRAPAPPPAARHNAPSLERALVLEKSDPAEPAPPANPAETPVRPVRLTVPVEAPVPQPAPLRAAAGDPPPPPPSSEPAELHGLERAIERAELRQSPQISELNLWMRPEHLGKVAIRLIERAGVVEIAVRAETSLARGWLAEGLPTLFERLQERGFAASALRGAEAGLEGRTEDHPDGRRQQWRDGQKRRDRHETTLFSLEPGETS